MTGGGQRLDDSKTGGGEDSNNCRGLTTNDWQLYHKNSSTCAHKVIATLFCFSAMYSWQKLMWAGMTN